MATGFSISTFRSKALAGEGARANLFDVLMKLPTIAGLTTNEMTYTVKAAQLPGRTVTAIDVPYFGRVVKVPGNKTFDNWSVTIINDEGFLVRNGMEKWVASMGSHIGNVQSAESSALSSALYGDATVQHYGKKGPTDKIASYTFKNIFPVSVSEIALGWDANDAVEEYTVEFAYDYWTHTGQVAT